MTFVCHSRCLFFCATHGCLALICCCGAFQECYSFHSSSSIIGSRRRCQNQPAGRKNPQRSIFHRRQYSSRRRLQQYQPTASSSPHKGTVSQIRLALFGSLGSSTVVVVGRLRLCELVGRWLKYRVHVRSFYIW
jgi:hypothetical protein